MLQNLPTASPKAPEAEGRVVWVPPRYQDGPEASPGSTQGKVEELASCLDLTIAAPDGHLLGKREACRSQKCWNAGQPQSAADKA